jgi:5-methylcytosine-specific restriction endonuclease McrA
MTDLTCHFDGCGRTNRLKRGLCSRHYQQATKLGTLADYQRPPDPPKYCRGDDCENLARPGRQGWCAKHASRITKYGDPNYVTPRPQINGVKPCQVPGCDAVIKPAKAKRCVICDQGFVGYGRQICCSVACRREEVARYGYASRRRTVEKAQSIEKFKRVEIFERDNWICQLCGEPVDRTARPRSSRSVSLDHIIPLILGGEHSRANTQTAHFGCNARKGHRVA